MPSKGKKEALRQDRMGKPHVEEGLFEEEDDSGDEDTFLAASHAPPHRDDEEDAVGMRDTDTPRPLYAIFHD